MIDKTSAREIIATSLNEIKSKKVVNRPEVSILDSYMDYRQIIALSGVRRCGKTYILFQLIKKLMDENKNVAYINFEDPRFDDRVEQLDLIYKTFLEHFGKEGRIYLFFDEVQNIKKWERWLAAMYEKDIKFFVSGSNASLLAGEFSKSLSGRHKLVKIYPLSFKQFVLFKDISLTDEKKWHITEEMSKIKRLLNEYLHYGGFPEVVFNGRKDILKDYFEDILTKDIISRHNIKFKQSLKELAFFLLTNVSSLHSLYSLNKRIQARSINTIKNYLMFLEDAYLLIKIPLFSFSLKKQLANPLKIYSIDVGMRNAVSFRFSEDMGKLYENATAIELIKRFGKESIFYWKSSKHKEVDFVLKQGLKIKQLIQVCYDLENIEAKKREIKTLLEASKELRCSNLLIITEDKEDEEKIKGKTIKYIPLWKWLLE